MPLGEIQNLNDEQNKRFAALAKKTRKSVSDLIHQALNEFLDHNIPRPKSADQIRNERDAALIQVMRNAAKRHSIQTSDVRRDFQALNTTQLMDRYHLPIEEVKEIQSYVKRT